jgi:hypothetical protein
MLPFLVSLLLLMGPPFWEVRAPAEWTEEDLEELMGNSPWSQAARAPLTGDSVRVYLATARPMQEAESELRRRKPHPAAAEDPSADEYREFLRENRGRVIVLSVLLPNWDPRSDPVAEKKLEEESLLRAGRRRYKMIGHFPPTPADPYLRLVYPRAVTAADKDFRFELYLPGLASPYRTVEYTVKDLLYKGQPEM